MTKLAAAALTSALAVFAFAQFGASGKTSFQELLTRPAPKADARIAYGKEALQFGDLYLPHGKGPYPVVLMIHGGCWLGELPGVELMAQISGDLRDHGFAVWNIEYRRIGQPGGGYPGTFEDVANGADALRMLAPKYHLDLNRVVAIGHSAGGHLVLWDAARARLPAHSALHMSNPLRLRGVVSLSGILDLAAYRADGPSACGGPQTIDSLVGTHAHPYADTSPSELLPLGVPQTIVSGSEDPIVPVQFGHAYAAKAKAAGDPVTDMEIPGAGHFEMIDPTSAAWRKIEAAIEKMAK